MEILKTRGIVLSTNDFGENDRQSTILTEDFGKKNLIFKGIRKSKRRSLTGSDPGTQLDIVYYYNPAKTFTIINDFKIISQPEQPRVNLNAFYAMCLILEVTEKSLGADDQHSTIYKMLEAAISNLDSTKSVIQLAAFYYIHLLKYLGILPDLGSCHICHRKESDEMIILPGEMKIVCSECALLQRERSKFRLNRAGQIFLNNALANKFNDFQNKGFSDDTAKDLIFLMIMYTENYFSINIKSKIILQNK